MKSRPLLGIILLLSSKSALAVLHLNINQNKQGAAQPPQEHKTTTVANMHLHMVHTSSYYTAIDATTTTNTTSMGPCPSMAMTSRVMRAGIQNCISAMSVSNSSSAFNASTSSPTHSTLHARSTGSTESQGLSKGAIIAIAAVVIVVGLALCCAASCASHRSTSHGHKHHAKSSKASAIPMQDYRSGAGLSAPPRSHGGRARAPQFPGPRNGFAAGGHSSRSTKGRDPYTDPTPFEWSDYGR